MDENNVLREIERACEKDNRKLSIYDATENDIKNGFEIFLNRRDDLAQIRSLDVDGKNLPLITEYIENDKIEELLIRNCDTVNELSLHEIFKNLRILKIRDSKFSSENIAKLQSLKELTISSINNINELSDGICALKNLSVLDIHNLSSVELYDWIGNLTTLDKLIISTCAFNTIPESIENLKNLKALDLSTLPLLEQLPENICNLQSINTLIFYNNQNLKTLPENFGNLQSLESLFLSYNRNFRNLPNSICDLKNLKYLQASFLPSLEKLPDNIGNLQSLNELILDHNENLKELPKSIGNLKKLKFFDIHNCVSIKHLPASFENLTSLEYANLHGTGIKSVPHNISMVDFFRDWKRLQIIPSDESISYQGFINSYYILLRSLTHYCSKSIREGLLALEDEIDYIEDCFFKDMMILMLGGNDVDLICRIAELSINRENDYYRKKLMEIALEGICCIQRGDPIEHILITLSLMVDIKDNPVDAAFKEYLAGNENAFNEISFSPHIKPEGEREEFCFIRRAVEMSRKSRKEGMAALKDCIDTEAAKEGDKFDLFEYGLSLLVETWIADRWKVLDVRYLNALLERLVQREKDPVQKNIAEAKKQAVILINSGANTNLLLIVLTAFFNKSIYEAIKGEYYWEGRVKDD